MAIKQATLTDTLTGRKWDLASLIAQHGEVTIGRAGFKDCVIGLGDFGGGRLPMLLDLKGKTQEQANIVLETIRKAAGVPSIQAIIRYQNHGFDGEGYYIVNLSDKPINVLTIPRPKGSVTYLMHGEKLFFGENKYPARVDYQN